MNRILIAGDQKDVLEALRSSQFYGSHGALPARESASSRMLSEFGVAVFYRAS